MNVKQLDTRAARQRRERSDVIIAENEDAQPEARRNVADVVQHATLEIEIRNRRHDLLA